MTNVVDVNGKQCDLSKAFPIKMGLYKKILTKGIDLSKGSLTTLESLDFMEIILTSANPEILPEDCEQLTAEEFTNISNLIQELSTSNEAITPLVDG